MAPAGNPAARFSRLCRFRLRLFRPLQGEVAFHLAARPLQHRARRDRAGGDAAGARLRSPGAEFLRYFFLRQDHDRSLLDAADRISVRSPHHLPLFPLHPHLAARQGGQLHADPGGRAHRRRGCAAARDRERCGHQNTSRRHPVAVIVGSRPSHTRHFGARRSRRHRERRRRSRRSWHKCETARAYAERARARGEAGNNTDAGTPPGVGHQPVACARRRRRGVAACTGQRRGPAAPSTGEESTTGVSKASCGTSRSL